MISKQVISTIKGNYIGFVQYERFEVEQLADPIEHWNFWFVRPDGTRSDPDQTVTEAEAIRTVSRCIAADAAR